MDFEKKYYLTQHPEEFLLVRWTRGYKEVEVYHHDQLLGTLANASRLKRGVFVESPKLGKVELTLTETPMTIQVIVDGYHARNNTNHPATQLKSASTYFTILAVFALLGAGFEAYRYSSIPALAIIISSVNIVVVIVYIVAAVFTRQSKPWAFYLGFSVFSLFTLLTLLVMVVLDFNIIAGISFLIRLAFQYFLITNLKFAIATAKHAKFGKRENEMLLDNI